MASKAEVEHARIDLHGALPGARDEIRGAQPGDVIARTPSGVGPIVAGERMTIKVEGVGTLSNPCVAG